jgi:hypothetical protein
MLGDLFTAMISRRATLLHHWSELDQLRVDDLVDNPLGRMLEP